MASPAQPGPAAPPGAADAAQAAWVDNPCALCGERAHRVLFAVAWEAAPGGAGRIVACEVCGLRRLDPRPPDERLSQLYDDDYYAYVGRVRSAPKQRLWDWLRDASSGATATPLAPLARAVAGWRFDTNISLADGRRPAVLDVGCGYGDLLLYLRERGCEVMGVDLDERTARAAGQLGLTVYARPLEELGLEPARLDVTVLQHSLEHLPHPDATIAEIARLTRPGGEVHISLPNGGSAGLASEAEFWGALSFPLHFWFFDLASLTQLLARHGFVVTQTGSKTIWINHWRLLRHLATADDPRLSRVGRLRAIARVLRALAATARDGRGDTLRVVARRVAP